MSALDKLAETFRTAWNDADKAGQAGGRVEAGLRAVFASPGALIREGIVETLVADLRTSATAPEVEYPAKRDERDDGLAGVS